MLADETEDLCLLSTKEVDDAGISLSGSDPARAEFAINRLPVSEAESVEQEIAHVLEADRPIEIT